MKNVSRSSTSRQEGGLEEGPEEKFFPLQMMMMPTYLPTYLANLLCSGKFRPPPPSIPSPSLEVRESPSFATYLISPDVKKVFGNIIPRLGHRKKMRENVGTFVKSVSLLLPVGSPGGQTHT